MARISPDRGVREYADNYHASETLKKYDNDSKKLAAAVTPLCEEALSRFNLGDVPGERAPADPVTIENRKRVAELVKLGATESGWNAIRARIEKERARAA
jgi:hypothetical protein